MAAIFIFLLVQMFCALKVKQAHTKNTLILQLTSLENTKSSGYLV